MKDTMRKLLSSFFLLVSLGFFTVASAQLPPEIIADKHLIEAEQLIEKEDYVSAFKVMKKVVALQKAHNLILPNEFLFKYAQVALKAFEPQTARDAVKQYLVIAEKRGQEALALLNKAEQIIPLEPEMVMIPSGSFKMGCVSGIDCYDDEKPVHEVKIDSFALSKYEVTFKEYDRFTDATGRERADDEGWGRGRRPVINISWHDAVAYTQWLSLQTGENYRLPSEAEWEYAARAGTETRYSWGDSIGVNRANCDGCGSPCDDEQTAPVGSFRANRWGLHDMHGNVWEWVQCPCDDEKTAPVGSFRANSWGLHDMHGNVREWVQDCWKDNYRGAPTDGSAWESGNCDWRVLRGGSWNYRPRHLRSANRSRNSTGHRYNYDGFRIVRSF